MKASKLKQKKVEQEGKSTLSPQKTLGKMRAQAIREQQRKSRGTFFLLAGKEKIEIPPGKVLNMIELLEQKMSPNDEVLTTQDVADLLNVSRPFVVKLIEEKKIPLAFKAGSQRRIYKQDALAYKNKMRNEQTKALDELTVESEELGLDF